MKQKAGAQGRKAAHRSPRTTQHASQVRRYRAAKEAKSAKPRSPAMRLAVEVERLAAELEASRARITELEARVDVDPLTETLNRRGFERALTRALAYVKRYSVNAALIYIDLDDFKPVNDRYGHAAGDAVLKAVAAALTRHVRASDVVARIGGDEFVVLLWNLSDSAADAKAAAIEATVYATPVRWGSSTLVVGASAGVAIVGPLDTPAGVIARADAAMYARKAVRQAHSGFSRARRELRR